MKMSKELDRELRRELKASLISLYLDVENDEFEWIYKNLTEKNIHPRNYTKTVAKMYRINFS